MDFTIVTALTPDYLNRIVWALPTWVYKPQFKDKPLIIFHSGFEGLEKLDFIKKLFNCTFIEWKMPEYENQRELMLSSFILGIKEHVKTPYFVKLDCDTFFTDDRDVFSEEDYKYDIVGHKWGYTKPGWWISQLDGTQVDKTEAKREHARIASFCCLHKTEFVVKVAKQCEGRLPVPSHDTVMWWYADKQGTWLGKNLKKLGVNNHTNWKKIREAVTVAKSHDNPYFNTILADKVQLEITTDCNLKCHNCDRCCGVAPSDESMGIEQIWKFVEESLQLKKRWARIDILGGEPTMYPHLDQLWVFLKLYKDKYPSCRIRFSTNGLQPVTVPKWVDVRNSKKKKRLQAHTAFNSAPIDNGEKETNCCSVPWRCGLSLSKYGYFLCGAGASIARVFGLDIGIKHLRNVRPQGILEQINLLCRLCGHSQVESRHIATEQEISPTWEKAIKGYREVVLGEY
ncbi:MAG: radical SAM protein [bacterium]|nr:radical SAM protein [bacterium]